MIPKGARFRWRFYDDDRGYAQSDWHVNGPECKACCCYGPDGFEHLEIVSIYEDGSHRTGHARFYTDDCSAS